MVDNIQVSQGDTDTCEDELGYTQLCTIYVLQDHHTLQKCIKTDDVSNKYPRKYFFNSHTSISCQNYFSSTQCTCSQAIKLGESVAMSNVKILMNGRTSVMRTPLTKQEVLSQYSSCFEGIGQFSGEPYKYQLKLKHRPARHAPRKVPVHLE